MNEELIIKNIQQRMLNSNSDSNKNKRKNTNSHSRINSRESVVSITRYQNKLYDKALEFTREVMAYPLLKKAWVQEEESENQAFSALFEYNLYYLLKKEGFSTENVITPSGKDLYMPVAFMDDNLLDLAFKTEEPEDQMFPAILYIFMCFEKEGRNIYSFADFIKHRNLDEGHCVTMKVPEYICEALKREPHPMCYIALTRPNPPDAKDFWTCTSAVLLDEPDDYFPIDEEDED